ncbi:hypothetical protein D3C76_1324340 [compost metagenome]
MFHHFHGAVQIGAKGVLHGGELQSLDRLLPCQQNARVVDQRINGAPSGGHSFLRFGDRILFIHVKLKQRQLPRRSLLEFFQCFHVRLQRANAGGYLMAAPQRFPDDLPT